MAEYLQAPPRRKALGLLADALTSGQEALNTVNMPYLGGLGGLLLGQAPEYLQDVSYGMPAFRGGNVATGGLGTLAPDTRMLDVATLPFVGAGAAKAGQVGAKTLGKEVARQVETGTGLLGSNVLDPRQYVLGNEKVLYHVTSPKNVPKILKEGIKPNVGKGFTKGQLGQTLSEKDTVYAFDNYNDALRWQTKMNYDATDPKKASQIVPFVDDITKYKPDTHPEYSDFIGVVKKQGSVKPEQIANVEYTKPIRKMAYGEITGQYPVEELQQFKNAIPYLPEARLLSGEKTFSPYATKYNTELNPIQNFWNTQGLSQRPINPEDYGILIKGLLGQ
jgi:hypothetical protein